MLIFNSPDIFDEYTRRQYLAKAPQRNPFGDEEDPKKFAEFDVFLKLRILVQLSQWTLNNADRIREKMEERGEMEQSVAWVRFESTPAHLDQADDDLFAAYE